MSDPTEPSCCHGYITFGYHEDGCPGAVVDAPAPDELAALRLRVEELTHERDQLRDSLRRAVDVADERFAHILESSVEIKDLESIVISHEKRAAEASARIAEEQFRAEKAERELGEARQALRLILMDLPVKRDWLDPNAERIARKIAGASSGHELMRVDGPNEK